MAVRLYSQIEKEKWDRYVLDTDKSNCYHLIGWKNVVEKTFRHKTYYLLSENNQNKINGILPIVLIKSILFGNYAISLPYFNYGGICSDDGDIGNQLLKEAIAIVQSENGEHIELRHVNPIDNRLPVKTAKASMRLRLPQNVEDLWKSFSSKLRSQIKKPSKEGMYSKLGREEELENFYMVFSQNMRDLGTPVYSKKFFNNILKEFPESTWICTVYTKEEYPVASGFLIGFREMLEIPWASSLRNYNRYSPNMLLYWSALKFGCENGYNVFDFGRSTPGEGTYKFKEQWGAKPVQLYWNYWLKNEGPLPELNPDNPKYKLAINIWKKLPVSLTKMIGPPIVKNLP